MPTYNLYSAFILNQPIGYYTSAGPGTVISAANGNLGTLTTSVTATFDLLDPFGSPYPSPGNLNLDVGSTITVNGIAYTVVNQWGSGGAGGGGTATYNGTPEQAGAYFYEVSDGTTTLALFFPNVYPSGTMPDQGFTDNTLFQDYTTNSGTPLISSGSFMSFNYPFSNFGSPAQDYIVEGTSGDDTIDANYTGDPEGDFIDNNDGNPGSPGVGNDDLVEAYGGNDVVWSGVGNDRVYGGTGNDTIAGFSGDDNLFGESGDDRLDGLHGNDTIYGGAGNDVVLGADGNDAVFGGAGNDVVFGGAGNDVIYTAHGDDKAEGGSGDDSIIGDLGNDYIAGGAGNDTIGGGAGNDFLDADSGDDVVYGDSGDDFFEESLGNDLIYGGAGVDNAAGGGGNDTFAGGFETGDTVVGGEDAGDADIDVLDLTDLGALGTDYTITYGGGNNEAGRVSFLTGPSAGGTMTFVEIERIISSAQDWIVEGTSGDDTIDAAYTGDPEGDLIDNNDGNPGSPGVGNDDLVEAYGGNDLVWSNAGNDRVYGGTGNDSINGQSGDDSLLGEAGNDTITGGYGDDYAEGGSGDDFIQDEDGIGGGGNDTFYGGLGNDVIEGGTGNDSLSGGVGNDILYGGIVGVGGNDTLEGNSGDDVIKDADSGDDLVVGGDGIDRVHGGYGSDTFSGSFESGDIVTGGEDPGDTDIDVLDLTGLGTAGVDYTITYGGGNNEAGKVNFLTGPSAGGIMTFSEIENVICFTTGTQIMTSRGEQFVEDLRVGDMVHTLDHGLQPIRWIGSTKVGGEALSRNPKLLPIRIKAGAFGRGLPAEDLRVSPQHRLMVSSTIARRLFDQEQVLVAAKQLVQVDGIDVDHWAQEVEYFHILFDRHEIIFAEGMPAESLYTGREALKSLPQDAVEEIFTLFPELRDCDPDHRPQAARFIAPGRAARKLAVHHSRSGKLLLELVTG